MIHSHYHRQRSFASCQMIVLLGNFYRPFSYHTKVHIQIDEGKLCESQSKFICERSAGVYILIKYHMVALFTFDPQSSR